MCYYVDLLVFGFKDWILFDVIFEYGMDVVIFWYFIVVLVGLG